MELKNSETLKNLTRSFAAECQDGAKYQYMADEATQNKQEYISTILKQLATNEMAHAKVFYDYISQNVDCQDLTVEIKASYPMAHAPLEEMLKIKGENEKKQAEVVYPAFAKTAKKEGFTEVAQAKIEAVHAMVLCELHHKLKNNTLYSFNDPQRLKCFNCGYEEILKKAWKKCPLCKKGQGLIKINLDCSGEDCHCVSNSINKSTKQTKTSSKTAKK